MNEEVLIVNEKLKARLLSSAKWAKFLGIANCILAVLLILAAILVFTLANDLSDELREIASYFGFTCLIVAALYIFPIVRKLQFARNAKAACLKNSTSQLADAFGEIYVWLIYSCVLTLAGIIGLVYVAFKVAPFVSEIMSYGQE